MPRNSTIGTCVCVLMKPGSTAMPRALMVSLPLYCAPIFAAGPTATMEPLSMAIAPSSMFGPAMVSTVPWVMRMSTDLGAARRGAARRTRSRNSFFGMGGVYRGGATSGRRAHAILPAHKTEGENDMASTNIYYALTIVANGVSSAAYYSVTPTSNLSILQGGVAVGPTGSGAVMVNIYPQTQIG